MLVVMHTGYAYNPDAPLEPSPTGGRHAVGEFADPAAFNRNVPLLWLGAGTAEEALGKAFRISMAAGSCRCEARLLRVASYSQLTSAHLAP